MNEENRNTQTSLAGGGINEEEKLRQAKKAEMQKKYKIMSVALIAVIVIAIAMFVSNPNGDSVANSQTEGTTTNNTTPVQKVPTDAISDEIQADKPSVLDIVPGTAHTVILYSDGTVSAVGNNSEGQFEFVLDDPVSFDAYVCTCYESKKWSGSFHQDINAVTYRTYDFGSNIKSE